MFWRRFCSFLYLLCTSSIDGEWNMYFTDRSNDIFSIQSHCFYYHVPHHGILYQQDEFYLEYEQETTSVRNEQSIAYCFRSSSIANELPVSNDVLHVQISFFEARQRNITSEDLYQWSMPIDLIEDYEYYILTNQSLDVSNMFLYNCTPPFFGPQCQYHFISNSTMTFAELAELAIRVKDKYDQLSQLPCYVHVNCTRGPSPICLDWREVCDNQLDCLDGEDEENCFALELNECGANEYRCQNGQCIPRTFFHDNSFNPDCLDRTDEQSKYSLYPLLCSADPSMRCEDSQCRPSGKHVLACGTGECQEINGDCSNSRNLQLWRALFQSSNVPSACRRLIRCWIPLVLAVNDLPFCQGEPFHQSYLQRINESCPEQFQFSSYPLFFGHLQLIYRKQRLFFQDELFLPTFICYNQTLCHLDGANGTYTSDQMTCRTLSEVIPFHRFRTNYDLYESIHQTFSACSSSRNRASSNATSLYRCRNSWKVISKHRLVDGRRDCPEDDDEEYPGSCSLADQSQRFHCSNDERNCFRLHQLNNGIENCRNGEDEISVLVVDTETRISFQTICDHFTELKAVSLGDVQVTDESDCGQWPCRNIYTQCDGIWNCEDGSDESNCQCPGQLCILRGTRQLTCLEQSKISDGHIDCVGASDERQYCRSLEKSEYDKRFFCEPIIEENECLSTNSLCDTRKDCVEGEDELYCKHFRSPFYFVDMCIYRSQAYNLTDIERFLCQLTETSKRKRIYFQLDFHNGSQPLLSDVASRQTVKDSSLDEHHLHEHLAQCHRGLPIEVWSRQKHWSTKCLCPPGYYGERCEYQNDRISLTVKLQTFPPDWRLVFAIVILLVDDQEGLIEFSEQLIYNHFQNCLNKFDLNLLYSTRARNKSKTFSVHVHSYDKATLVHRASWFFPIQFPFLPVYRLATEIPIPLSGKVNPCAWNCSSHGQCLRYENHEEFCLCDQGWSGWNCSKEVQCHCSRHGRCLSSSLCICKGGYFGRRCFLRDTHCQVNPCENNGSCHSPSPEDLTSKSSCICPEGYSGVRCERADTKLVLDFADVSIPPHVFIHFVEVFRSSAHLRTTTLQKMSIGEESVLLSTSIDFHLIFAELQSNYYLLFVNGTNNQSTSIVRSTVTASKRCQSIFELLNSSFAREHLLIRIKYYHQICEKNLFLSCFYDEVQMCLCLPNRHANCLEFNHQMIYNCRAFDHCENEARCFQNHPYCPTSSLCVCEDCYYGSRCQFSTKGFALSLDTILGYQIIQKTSFHRQTVPVKVCTSLVCLLFLCGCLSGVLSLITFRREQNRRIGCEIYLYSSAVCLLINITLFKYKFWFLLLSQMFVLKTRSVLLINCLLVDYSLRALISLNDWLYACVAIERVISVMEGVKFNPIRSIRLARWIVLLLCLSIFVSHLHDPFHRRLMEDEEDNRIWCVTRYSSTFQMFDTIVNLGHFFIPFLINIVSSLLTIIKLAQKRTMNQEQRSYLQRFYRQIREHRHILISPFLLILVSLPRLVISFVSDCMKSQRDPWLFLIAYLISFVPSIAHFILFVLPSESYKNQFSKAILRIQRRFRANRQ